MFATALAVASPRINSSRRERRTVRTHAHAHAHTHVCRLHCGAREYGLFRELVPVCHAAGDGVLNDAPTRGQLRQRLCLRLARCHLRSLCHAAVITGLCTRRALRLALALRQQGEHKHVERGSHLQVGVGGSSTQPHTVWSVPGAARSRLTVPRHTSLYDVEVSSMMRR